jgi:AraC family transcriptional regulator
MLARRAWIGLDVALVETPAGATRVAASDQHRLGVHVGRPVRASCRFAGRTHRRLQSRGDIDLLPAGAPGVWEDDRSTRILQLRITPALLATTAVDMGIDPDRIDLAPQFQLRDRRIEHIAGALEAELEEEAPSDALYGESLAVALASHLVLRFRASPGAPPLVGRGLSRAQLLRVTEYIDANLGGALSLAELASVAGVGASHFKTLFKRSTRVPVHQYVVRRRVEHARLLLASGAESPAAIALRVGFSDQSHMARWIRRALGTTPTALRRGPG